MSVLPIEITRIASCFALSVAEIKIPLPCQESGIEIVKIWSRFVELESYSVNCLYMVDIIQLLQLFPHVADMLFK